MSAYKLVGTILTTPKATSRRSFAKEDCGVLHEYDLRQLLHVLDDHVLKQPKDECFEYFEELTELLHLTLAGRTEG